MLKGRHMSFFEISSILLWVVVLVNLILTLAIIRNLSMMSATPVETLAKGTVAPDFQAEYIDGKIVIYEDFAGKPLVLVFVSPTCGHCLSVIPEIEKQYLTARIAGYEIVFVCDADIEQTKDYVNELNITIPIMSAPRSSNQFYKNYKIGGVPSYVIIDSNKEVSAANVFNDQDWNDFVKFCERKEK